ncbi:MAG: S41 family peptidase [Gammaproteobacteria bacterium]|nr:S41 family peptidase [Gammaproteobacteria bacterium]
MNLRPITIIAVLVSMLGGISLGVAAFWSAVYYEGEARHERLLVAAAREIQGSYIAEVDPDDLVDNAIRGMMEGLDGHSAFLDGDALVVLEEETTGRFGGIGIEVGMADGLPTVIAPIAGGPAERAGIEPGDRLIEVDHRPLEGRTLSDAVRDLRGEPGTPVHVRIRRPTEVEPLDFDLTRGAIASVVSRSLSAGTGYVRIYQFDRPTRTDLDNAIQELQREGPLSGLVLDLRGNPGGLLETAVDVADAFLIDGVIVTIEGREARSQRTFYATPDALAEGVPIAVLINGQSASGSEVVAGALKDRGRAVLIGAPSYGKGSVQSVIRLGSGALKLTTAHYLTPAGHSIDAGGVVPDIRLPRRADETLQDHDQRILDAALGELQKTATG